MLYAEGFQGKEVVSNCIGCTAYITGNMESAAIMAAEAIKKVDKDSRGLFSTDPDWVITISELEPTTRGGKFLQLMKWKRVKISSSLPRKPSFFQPEGDFWTIVRAIGHGRSVYQGFSSSDAEDIVESQLYSEHSDFFIVDSINLGWGIFHLTKVVLDFQS